MAVIGYSSSPAFCAAANVVHWVDSRWLGVARGGSGWLEMARDGSGWLGMARNRAGWAEWLGMARVLGWSWCVVPGWSRCVVRAE
eukprot:3592325-Prymnesium_polylepis.1